MHIFINLTNLAHNIKKIKEYAKIDIIAVVKSNAYGLGSKRIIPELITLGINWFAFNKIEEYLPFQELLTNQNSIILSSLTKEKLSRHYHPNMIVSINSYQDFLNISDFHLPIRVHLQIDTGMNRVGLKNIEVVKMIINEAKTNPNIIIEGIYTHYSSGVSEYQYYEYQRQQFDCYLDLYPFLYFHSKATSSLHKQGKDNLVRVGMAMYGYHQTNLCLKPVVSGKTKLLNILEVDYQQGVGYDQAYKPSKKELIGVLPFGYYEMPGLKHLYYFGKKYKIIGKKCMNHSYIVVDEQINILSRLSIFGKNDIIITDEYNWYHLLVSLTAIAKNYIKREKYEIPRIFKITNEKSYRFRIRK